MKLTFVSIGQTQSNTLSPEMDARVLAFTVSKLINAFSQGWVGRDSWAYSNTLYACENCVNVTCVRCFGHLFTHAKASKKIFSLPWSTISNFHFDIIILNNYLAVPFKPRLLTNSINLQQSTEFLDVFKVSIRLDWCILSLALLFVSTHS
jgi:hypothetical protein